jgi:excisionase family DNA binding protein
MPYSMTCEDAARELGCGPGDVEKLAQDGDLRNIMRGTVLYLSAEDVRRWHKVQRRNSRHCRALDDAIW